MDFAFQVFAPGSWVRISQFWGTRTFMGHQRGPCGTRGGVVLGKNSVPRERLRLRLTYIRGRFSGTPLRVLVGHTSVAERNDPCDQSSGPMDLSRVRQGALTPSIVVI